MKQNLPIISVVIPIYNVEKYLGECLDSIIHQSLQNIEILIINDFSPDNSESIILEYIQKDPRIKYIKHTENLGLGGARNTGIKHATGEWIAFIDSDDFLEKDCYLNMYTLLTNSQADCGVFGVINFNDNNNKEFHDSYFDIPNTPTNDMNILFSLSKTTWNKVYKTKDIKNITFPEHLKHEDEEFWYKYIVTYTPTIVGDSKKYYHYRQRENSITSNFQSSFLDSPKIVYNIYNYYEQNNYLIKYYNNFAQILLAYRYLSLQLTFENKQKFDHEFNYLLNSMTPLWKDFFTLNINLHNITNDKYYKFGQLSSSMKIKKIIKIIFKKIFK